MERLTLEQDMVIEGREKELEEEYNKFLVDPNNYKVLQEFTVFGDFYRCSHSLNSI